MERERPTVPRIAFEEESDSEEEYNNYYETRNELNRIRQQLMAEEAAEAEGGEETEGGETEAAVEAAVEAAIEQTEQEAARLAELERTLRNRQRVARDMAVRSGRIINEEREYRDGRTNEEVMADIDERLRRMEKSRELARAGAPLGRIAVMSRYGIDIDNLPDDPPGYYEEEDDTNNPIPYSYFLGK